MEKLDITLSILNCVYPPESIMGKRGFVYAFSRMALTSVIFAPRVNVTVLPSWVSL